MTLPLLPSTLPNRTVDEARRALLVAHRLHDQLGDALGRAHHARWVHGLVGRDQDEALDAVAVGGLRDRSRVPMTLFLTASHGLCFHQRHVLVGRRVEDDVGPVLCEHLVHARSVGDVADDGRDSTR